MQGTRYSKTLPGHQGLEFTSSRVQRRLVCTNCLRSAPVSFPLRSRTPFRGDGQRHRTPSELEIREVRAIRVSLGKDVPRNPVPFLWFPY